VTEVRVINVYKATNQKQTQTDTCKNFAKLQEQNTKEGVTANGNYIKHNNKL